MISAFYGMEIPYGKREFIVEEDEQHQVQQVQQVQQQITTTAMIQQQQQAMHPVIPIDEKTVQITQENCHAQVHKMMNIHDAHLLVTRKFRVKLREKVQLANFLFFYRRCKKITSQ